jgi:hypothetical protein
MCCDLHRITVSRVSMGTATVSTYPNTKLMGDTVSICELSRNMTVTAGLSVPRVIIQFSRGTKNTYIS